jgi:hypothetical protein
MDQNVMQEIEQERAQQDRQWGGADHDDTHGPMDWFTFIAHQLQRAVMGRARPREVLIKITALAIAGLESAKRKNQEEIYPRITNKGTPFECQVKAFNAPILISDKCPKCGEIVHKDLNGYLNYPNINDWNLIVFEHNPDEKDDKAAPCGAHWTVHMRLTLTASLDKP